MSELRLLPGATRARRGELLSVGGAMLLLLVMFSLAWYGVAGIPGRSRLTSAEDAWHALTLTRWVMLLTIFVAIFAVPLHASQRLHGAKTNTGTAVMLLGSLTAAVLLYRVLIELPSANQVMDQKLGAVLGLLCAVAIAFGGWETMRGERELALDPTESGSRRQRDKRLAGRAD